MKSRFYSRLFTAFFTLLFAAISFSQQSDAIISSFESYTDLPREIAYAQLNKSTFIKGEMIGFSAYILDKDTKEPSDLTTNLYCSISDSENNIIKTQLIKVENGYAWNTFEIDDKFTTGTYILKAYTNWMKNFDEQNLFVESFKIIDPTKEDFIKPEKIENTVDAQFLPEGGHLLSNVQNTIGVIVKDANGFGIPTISMDVFDKRNNLITSCKTSQLGIGRFLLTPLTNELYTVKFQHLGKSFSFPLGAIKTKGIAIAVNDLNDQVAVTLKTNSLTLPSIINKAFKLSLHNGTEMKVIDFDFEKLKITKVIDYKDLYTGVNIFTVFDDNNRPIVERLFFKHDGLNKIKTGDVSVKRHQDSLNIKIPLQQFNPEIASNFSVSVLPEETKSYNRHHNIISYTYLQPYVNGQIENASHYFENVNRKTKYELDNLLITQGWSSYDWTMVFNHIPKENYPFENGIGFKANVNSKDSAHQYLMYALSDNNGDLFTLTEDQKAFLKSGLYPIEDESLRIGEINRKGKLEPSQLYLQFYPSKIPSYHNDFTYLNPKSASTIETSSIEAFEKSSLDKIQELEQVVIKATPKYTRAQRLQARSYGKVDVFDDKMRQHIPSLPLYFSRKGYYSQNVNGDFILVHPVFGTPNIFLDGIRLTSHDFLLSFTMDTIDYIEIKRSGLGDGLASGSAGPVIKIWTDTTIPLKKQVGRQHYQSYDMPLTFTKAKTFYVPKYKSYSSDFFKEYGIIGWTPKATVTNNKIELNVYDTQTERLRLYIEGLDANGHMISEEKIITLN